MNKLILMAAATWMAGISQASTVPIFGNGALGDFTGSVAYTSNMAGTSANLVVSLTNTSPAANGGFLTAFAFNVPSGVNFTSVSFSESSPNSGPWQQLGSLSTLNSVQASPNGYFDLGASINSSFLGGGAPGNGLAVGESATFTFTFAGTGLNAISTSTFLGTQSNLKDSDDKKSEAFMARFRGFEDDGSDKVPGQVVPEPSTYAALLASGVAFLAWRKRRR